MKNRLFNRLIKFLFILIFVNLSYSEETKWFGNLRYRTLQDKDAIENTWSSFSEMRSRLGFSFERQKIVNDFNSDKFQVLVVTKAGGEGLDLKGVRSVVVMDPTWNDAGLQQVIGRAIRYKSHIHLPQEEQKVTVYFMILSIPLALQNEGDEEKPISGDYILYNIMFSDESIFVIIVLGTDSQLYPVSLTSLISLVPSNITSSSSDSWLFIVILLVIVVSLNS